MNMSLVIGQSINRLSGLVLLVIFLAASGCAPSPAPKAITVQVSVTASDGVNPLSYSWRTTDGVIENVNAATTNWTLPDGPGLHFAYVLVSNGKGGYIERRVAVNTDTIGNPLASFSAQTIAAPAATVQPGQINRDFMTIGRSGDHLDANGGYVTGQDIQLVDTPVYLQSKTNGFRFPSASTVKTNLKGEFSIPGVVIPPNATDLYHADYNCSLDSGVNFVDCGSPYWRSELSIATTEYTHYIDSNGPYEPVIVGTVFLADGSVCGVSNEFFGKEITATATLVDSTGNTLVGPVRADINGGYGFRSVPSAASVVLQCESAPSVTVAVGPADPLNTNQIDLGRTTFAGTSVPTISAMAATRNGSSIGIFLPPPSQFPSDNAKSNDHFLAFKGLDSRLSACKYYKSIGAVKDCDAAGNFIGAVHFDDWKRAVKIGAFSTPGGPTEFVASYINQVDLNLTRNHHSISYGPNQTGAYVCNHLGPTSLTPTQAEIDTVIDNAIAGKNLVACVAMDYSVSPGVNGDQPFTKFLIFGPSGELLPSVNLDGRSEKFVPGTCVACHGGDHYAGKFSEDGTGPANIGAYFLPYDSGNFAFSSKPGLTEADQALAIYNLNQNLHNTGPNAPIKELLNGWYGSGKVFNKNYIPISWQGQSAVVQNFYKDVYARSCRTCHISMVEGYNFDHYQNLIGSEYADNGSYDTWEAVCNASATSRRRHTMPNSLVTFNRFWLSSGTAADQVSLTKQFMQEIEPYYGADCPTVVKP